MAEPFVSWDSLDRKLERCAREIAEEAAARARAAAPRDGLTKPEQETEPVLPEGVWESQPGVFKAHCRACGESYELCYSPDEFSDDGNYCGGSPWCCP